MKPAAIIALLLVLIGSPFALAQPPVEYHGDWKGLLDVGAKVRVALHVGESTTFDSLDQGAIGMPAKATFTDNMLKVDITGVGRYEATLSADGQMLTGALVQGGSRLPLSFERGAFEVAKRPQTPKPPFPYRAEDVAYDNAAAKGVRLAGTLTLPAGDGPFPAVVLISGSGAQDRDSTVFDHKPFMVVADYLSRRGIAVLRVDDRGAGKSIGATAADTSADYAGDVAASIAFLRARAEIDGKRVGLIGHSEGGMIAPMVAAKDPTLAFMVLWAGGSVPGKDVVVEQARLAAAMSGATSEQVEQTEQLQTKLLDAIIAEPNTAAAMSAVNKVFVDAGEPPPPAAALAPLMSAWYRFFIAYDPGPALKAAQVPVLALLGEKDTQVTPAQNLSAFEAAFAGREYASVRVLPGLNHFFQTAPTGATSEYGEIEETMSPLALDQMATWIMQQIGLAPKDDPARPLPGAIVESFEMVPDRTVIFAPLADGRMRIIRVTDKDRLAPMPRNPGEVAIAMTYALEIGAVIEFNSGLAYTFSYDAAALGAGDTVPLPTCPVRGDAVATDQWPQGFKLIRIGPLKRIDGPAACEHPAQ